MMLQSNYIYNLKEEIDLMAGLANRAPSLETKMKIKETQDTQITRDQRLKEEWRHQEMVIRDMRVLIIKQNTKPWSMKKWEEKMKLASSSL